MTLSLHVLWWIAVSLALLKLSMLFEASLCCMSAISDVWEREVKGRWKERRGRWGNGGKKVSKLQIVGVRDGGCCVFFPFLFLATTLHTAGRLIHSSIGLQYENSNYKGIFFFVIFGCHPSLDQKSLSYMQRPAWIVQKKIHYMSLAHAQRVEY